MIEPEEHRPAEGSSSANFNLYTHELLSVGLVNNENENNSGNAAESRQITAAIILDEDDFIISKEDEVATRPLKRMRFEASSAAPLFCPRLWNPAVISVPPVSASCEFQMSHFQHAAPSSVDETVSSSKSDGEEDED